MQIHIIMFMEHSCCNKKLVAENQVISREATQTTLFSESPNLAQLPSFPPLIGNLTHIVWHQTSFIKLIR